MKKPKPKRPTPSTLPTPQPLDWRWLYVPVVWVILTVSALAAYWNSFEGRLFFDDLSSVIGNPYVQVFVNPYFSQPERKWTRDGLLQAFNADIDTPFAGRPWVSFTFALTHWWAFETHPAEIPEFYGVLPPHYKFYHRVNFGFHLACALMMFHLLRRTFRAPNVRAQMGRFADLWAAAVALVWVVHPINTETVVYVTQRTEQVISLFLLLMMYCGSRSIDAKSRWATVAWQFAAFLFCHWGMNSKENMVAAPLLLVLYDRAFYFTTWRETIAKRWTFYLPIFLTYSTLAGRNDADMHFGLKTPDASVALYVVKDILRSAVIFIPVMILDRVVYFTNWRETLRARGVFYGAAFGVVAAFSLAYGAAAHLLAEREIYVTAYQRLQIDQAGFAAPFYFVIYALLGLDMISVALWLLPLAAVGLAVAACDRFLHYGSFREALAARWPYYATIVGLFMAVHLAPTAGPRGMSVGFDFERMNWYEYLITQCWCLLRYLRISVIPTGLCVDYGRLAILDLPHVVPGAIVVLSLLGLTVWGLIKRPWVGFLGCWFFFILAPTSSIIPIVTEVGAERRMYLPVAAVLLGIGIGLGMLIRRISARNPIAVNTERFYICLAALGTLLLVWVLAFYNIDDIWKDKQTRWAYLSFAAVLWLASSVFVLLQYLKYLQPKGPEDGDPGIVGTTISCGVMQMLVVVFTVMSYHRNQDYLTDSRLYGHIPETFPWNERGCNNYAKICIDEGREAEAEVLLNQALRIDPEYSDAFTNRGIIFHRRREMDRAIMNATEAIRWNPLNPSAWNNRGNAFIELKLFEKAIDDFTQLVNMNPRGVEGYYGRANTYYLWGKLKEALADISNVIERSPGDYKAYNTKGNILKQMGNYREAVTAFNTGIDLLIKEARSAHHPCLPAVEACLQGNLAQHNIALQFGNRTTLATIFGNRADAYRNLTEQFPNAQKLMFDDLTRAIIMHPENVMYFLARGQQYYNTKAFPQALNDFEQVLRMQPQNLDGIRGKILSAYEMKNWDIVWQMAKMLRDANMPVDEPTLKKWREESGRDYPQ